MTKFNTNKKVTLATVKSLSKKNINDLYIEWIRDLMEW